MADAADLDLAMAAQALAQTSPEVSVGATGTSSRAELMRGAVTRAQWETTVGAFAVGSSDVPQVVCTQCSCKILPPTGGSFVDREARQLLSCSCIHLRLWDLLS